MMMMNSFKIPISQVTSLQDMYLAKFSVRLVTKYMRLSDVNNNKKIVQIT
jgi:hypothetical protein